MSKRPPIPAPIVRYIQHGIDVTHYDRDPELWPPFRSPLFEVTERADGVRTTECIALPVPHGLALRRALAFGLSEAERDAIHEFLGAKLDADRERSFYVSDDAQPSLF